MVLDKNSDTILKRRISANNLVARLIIWGGLVSYALKFTLFLYFHMDQALVKISRALWNSLLYTLHISILIQFNLSSWFSLIGMLQYRDIIGQISLTKGHYMNTWLMSSIWLAHNRYFNLGLRGLALAQKYHQLKGLE